MDKERSSHSQESTNAVKIISLALRYSEVIRHRSTRKSEECYSISWAGIEQREFPLRKGFRQGAVWLQIIGEYSRSCTSVSSSCQMVLWPQRQTRSHPGSPLPPFQSLLTTRRSVFLMHQLPCRPPSILPPRHSYCSAAGQKLPPASSQMLRRFQLGNHCTQTRIRKLVGLQKQSLLGTKTLSENGSGFQLPFANLVRAPGGRALSQDYSQVACGNVWSHRTHC